MKIAYFDCYSGIAGDMLLGARVDAGVAADSLGAEIPSSGSKASRYGRRSVRARGIGGTDVQVVTGHDHAHRHLSTIEKIIDGSELAAGDRRASSDPTGKRGSR